jgi:two-component system LytT family response regulator
MRVVLADDEPLALQRLSQALQGMADVTIVGVANDGNSALGLIRELDPDLAILDIEMPGFSGLEVASALQTNRTPQVVFLTAFDRYAAQAFSVEAADYLLKPVSIERLRLAIERVRRRRTERAISAAEFGAPQDLGSPQVAGTLHLPDRDGGRDLPQAEIVWIEAAKDYVLIYTQTRSYILRITMLDLARQLHATILRVHRSAFVSAVAIRRRLRSERGLFSLLLSDGAKVQVGPSYARAVRARLRSLRPDLD